MLMTAFMLGIPSVFYGVILPTHFILVVVLFSSCTLLVISFVRLAFSTVGPLLSVVSAFLSTNPTASRNDHYILALVILNSVNGSTEFSFLVLSCLTAIKFFRGLISTKKLMSGASVIDIDLLMLVEHRVFIVSIIRRLHVSTFP